jgi:hypothetical protein
MALAYKSEELQATQLRRLEAAGEISFCTHLSRIAKMLWRMWLIDGRLHAACYRRTCNPATPRRFPDAVFERQTRLR